eukprot:CAMPEP_0119013268 /NCGR_PEP_ID=MMETSP1176-20130426/8272_1 /TAXON_ID=265551 /ORGANISM="Synedropsis recta cf, Strain CCMP1620" /LENGTH=141 /DNA_ID=CAMNT_0006966349 /DNA_START=101 /DNA_END=523 /DNA_ORIENTATION=-
MAPNTKQNLFTPLELSNIAQEIKAPLHVSPSAQGEIAIANYWNWTPEDTPSAEDTYWSWSSNPHEELLSAASIENNLMQMRQSSDITGSSSSSLSSSDAHWAEDVTEKYLEEQSGKYWSKNTTPEGTKAAFWDSERADEYW